MKTKKTRRTSGPRNGAVTTHLRIILADSKLHRKIYLAIMRGSVAGAFLAFLAGACLMESSVLEGLIIAGAGLAWMVFFWLRNSDDEEVFGG